MSFEIGCLQQTVTGCKLDYIRSFAVCPVVFCKKIIFGKFLHSFIKMNAIKHGKPRKSEQSGCQNSDGI